MQQSATANLVWSVVCSFAVSRNKTLMNYEDNHDKVESTEWKTFFKNMRKRGMWASGPVAQVTVWLLERDILVISEGNTKENPYMIVNGNRDGDDGNDSQHPPIVLGNSGSIHIQSFFPVADVPKNPAVLESPLPP